MLIRMSRAAKAAPDGFTVVPLRKDVVYQVPDELGRALVENKDAVAVAAGTHRDALPRAQILAGRPANAAAT